MEREARGDAELSRDFEAVMEAHEGALLRYATGLLRDAHAAQDVVQNVFVKLFRSRPAARGVAAYSVRAWLYRVAHNEAVDYLRHEGRLRAMHENHGREVALRKDKAGGAGGDGRMELALQCVDRLDAAERLAGQLDALGFPARLQSRVLVGPYATRQEAQQAAERLKRQHKLGAAGVMQVK